MYLPHLVLDGCVVDWIDAAIDGWRKDSNPVIRRWFVHARPRDCHPLSRLVQQCRRHRESDAGICAGEREDHLQGFI